MGIFYTQVPVFNVAPVDITVIFDGQQLTLPPGPGQMPEVAIQYGKNQNPIMGSCDPNNPHISGGRYLLRDARHDDCTPMTKAEWEDHLQRPCRTDEEAAFAEKYGNDPKAKQVVLGKGRKSTAASRYEAGASPQGISDFGKDR